MSLSGIPHMHQTPGRARLLRNLFHSDVLSTYCESRLVILTRTSLML